MNYELAVYFANTQQLFQIDEALHAISLDEISGCFQTIFFTKDTSSREYYQNLVALEWLEKSLEEGHQISRLYFGQEFCMHLIPSRQDLSEAYYYARQLGWDFTYTTGTCTDAVLDKQRENLAFLAEQDDLIEVVVNDWGLLRLLRREFPDLQPVLGRLLHKQKRLARFTTMSNPPPINTKDIESEEGELRSRQLFAYQETCLNDPDWQAELRELGVTRTDIDFAPQGLKLSEDFAGLPISCYYPWGYVAGGRNCATAGTIDPQREFIVDDTPCSRPCQRYNKSAVLSHLEDPIIQRGNSIFIFHGEYDQFYFTGRVPVDRFIFEPYIPI